MSNFHNSKRWRNLAKAHKSIACMGCKSLDDIESAHYLPQSRFPMMALWRSNLYFSCKRCNAKLGDKIKWSSQAIKLLAVYFMMLIIKWVFILMVIVLMARIVWIDLHRGPWDTTITNQVYNEAVGLLNNQPVTY